MATIYVPSGGNFQEALNAAVGGDVITLAAGAIYEGNFTVPVHTGSAVVTVRSAAADGSLPADGYRMLPSYSTYLPKLRGQQVSNYRTTPALKFEAGAKNWRFMFLEVAANYWGDGEMISIGVNDSTQTEWNQQPENITFDRNYIHGNRLWGQKRGIGFHGKNIQIINNWFDKFGSNGQDSQCISGGNGEGPITILNNRFEGGTYPSMVGGDRAKISTSTTIVSMTSLSAFKLASTARLKIGMHMYFKVSDTVVGQWTYCQSFNAATGDVTVAPPLTTAPAIPGDVQWGAIMKGITYRRNHCIKPIIEMTEGVILTPTGLAGTVGTGGVLPAGTYNYAVQAHNTRGYGGNPVRSNASATISKTVAANGVVNLSWVAALDAGYYRVYRQLTGGTWYYKDTAGVATTLQDNGSGWTAGDPTTGSKRVHKNIFEFKSGYDWQIDSNIFENHWRGSDVGIACWMKSNSQEGREPFNHSDRIVFEKNLLRHVFGFFSVSGRVTSVGYSAATLPDGITSLIIRQNLVFDSQSSPYGQGSTQYSHAVQNGAKGVVIDHNTIISAMKGTGFLNTNSGAGLMPGLVYKNNFLMHGTYGLRGQTSSISTAEGTVSLDAYTSGDYFFERNVIQGASASLYPANNEFPSQATFEAQFEDYSGGINGDYRLTATSRYRTTWLGTDGKPIGVDIDALMAAVDGVDAGDPEAPVTEPSTSTQAYVITGSGGLVMGGSAVIEDTVPDPLPDPDPGPGPDPTPDPDPDPFPDIPPYAPPTNGGIVGLGINPTVGESLCGGENVMPFVAWKGNAYSTVQINDPDGYYFGPKLPLVKSFGSVERALSGFDGQFEMGSASITFADPGRDIRQALGLSGAARNTLIDFFMYSDVTRRAQGEARRIFQGVIKKSVASAPLTATFSVEDWFGSQFCAFDVNKNTPTDLILPSYFTNAPLDVYGLPEPLAYGRLSDELPTPSATAAPVIIDTGGRGFLTDGGVKQVGFGNNDAIGPIATALSGTAAAGGTIPAGTWGLMITSVDAAGRESDPYPFFSDAVGGWDGGVPTVSVSGTQKIVANFTHDPVADPTGVYLRIYLGFYYFGARWTQYVQVPVTATTCEFTTAPIPPGGVEGTLDTVTPGAVPVAYAAFAWYYVTAVMTDGETVGSARAFHIQRGYRRFNWIEWTPIAGALGYRVYKSNLQTGDVYARWDLPATQTVLQDDMLGSGSVPYRIPVPVGVVKTRYVGDFLLNDGQTWRGLLVCRGCAAGIESWYASDTADPPSRIRMPETTEGADFLIPERLNWQAIIGPQKYIDINDRRYTMIFVRGPRGDAAADGTVPVTVNMYGYEEIGDGTGLYIDDLPRQYLHYLTNFVIQPTTKLWQSIPVNAYGYSVINGQSFEDAKDYYDTITGGRGLKGAWQLGWEQQEQLGSVIAQLNQNVDGELFTNSDGQLTLDVLDTSEVPLAPPLYDVSDVLEDSLSIADEDGEFFDEVAYYYGKVYAESVTAITPPEDTPLPRELTDKTEWLSGLVSFYDPDAIRDLAEVRTLTLNFYMLRDQASADLIARRKLARYGVPPIKAVFDMDLCGLNYELGDIISLTHFAGLSTVGWITQKLRVERLRTDIDGLKTTLECRAINFVYDSV